MINLRIVVAVSEYKTPTSSLSACERDGAALFEIMQSSGRFDDILYIHNDTTSTNVKRKITEFAKSHNGKQVDEVIFYFTGHGDFAGNEFHYLLSDYEQLRPKQTALENSELDNIVRALGPRLFVKIVDACHSGVPHIKNTDDFDS
jgi:hypothetical protein